MFEVFEFPVPCPIDTIRDSYRTERSFKNTRTVLRCVNSHLRQSITNINIDYLYPKLWHDECENICKHLAHHYKAHESDRQKSIILGMSGVMTRIMGHEYNNPYKIKAAKVAKAPYVIDSPKVDPKPKSTLTWEDALLMLEPPYNNIHAAIRCILYKHGFAWRTEQVYNTSFKDIDGFNWIDLDNKVCHVRRAKSQKNYKLQLPDDLVTDLKHYNGDRGEGWIIPKSNGTRYVCLNTVSKRFLPAGVSDNVEMRNSFQAWMMEKYKGDEEQIAYWNAVMDIKTTNGAVYYYNEPDVEEKESEEESEEIEEVCLGRYKPASPGL